jgi:hypothetical protein
MCIRIRVTNRHTYMRTSRFNTYRHACTCAENEFLMHRMEEGQANMANARERHRRRPTLGRHAGNEGPTDRTERSTASWTEADERDADTSCHESDGGHGATPGAGAGAGAGVPQDKTMVLDDYQTVTSSSSPLSARRERRVSLDHMSPRERRMPAMMRETVSVSGSGRERRRSSIGREVRALVLVHLCMCVCVLFYVCYFEEACVCAYT